MPLRWTGSIRTRTMAGESCQEVSLHLFCCALERLLKKGSAAQSGKVSPNICDFYWFTGYTLF
jgi:hypothetical protein